MTATEDRDVTTSPAPPPTAGAGFRALSLGGTRVELAHEAEAVDAILDAARQPGPMPLGVVSANLDHIHHFGVGGRWRGTLEHAENTGAISWLTLLDGAPLVSQATRLTGQASPRLAGSDIIDAILRGAAAEGLSVGFIGGSDETHEMLRARLPQTHPGLDLAGCWSPSREELADREQSEQVADEIRAAGVDILVVCLGKPRQELWIAEHGARTGAGVLLAFGAVVDFLAGRVSRAPEWASRHGLEWAYRLGREPRRLARRYLVDGPPSYRQLRVASSAATGSPGRPASDLPPIASAQGGAGAFRAEGESADVTAVVVAYNSGDVIGSLLDDLRHATRSLRLRVVVVDNGSTDDTLAVVATHPDAICVRAPGNVGYAAGINIGMRHAGDARGILVLNPDLRLDDGAIEALWRRLWEPGVAAVVPGYGDSDIPSIRREPSVLRSAGDALLGSSARTRPAWLGEVDYDPESYRYAHPVDWATGACLLVRRAVADAVGDWDERFFLYSEEVDFMRRVREDHGDVWFEPSARVQHEQGGSGTSPQLVALSTVNRVRYARKWHGPTKARATGASLGVGALLRSFRPEQRIVLAALLSRSARAQLPRGEVDRAV